MPLTGEYEPSPSAWSRKQAELYEATNGEEGAELRGRPVIVLTSVGAKTGKLRKTPPHAGRARRRLRGRRVSGRRSETSRLVPQPKDEPAGRAARPELSTLAPKVLTSEGARGAADGRNLAA